MPAWGPTLPPPAQSQKLALPGDRRGDAPEIALPIQDYVDPNRRVVGCHDDDQSRSSHGGADETIDSVLSRIIGDDELDTFRTSLESVWETKYVDTERILRADLQRAFVLSNTNVAEVARSNIDRELAVMTERMKQFTAATTI